MIRANTNWNGTQTEAQLYNASWEGIQRATLYFWQLLLQVLNISADPQAKTRTRKTSAGPKGSTYTVYANPSKPGEPPHKRTGWLQRHVQYELDEPNLRSRVGLNVAALYGLFLDLGTRKMLARPWLLATLRKYLPQISAQAVP